MQLALKTVFIQTFFIIPANIDPNKEVKGDAKIEKLKGFVSLRVYTGMT
jgi:hypothetical protein